MDIPFKKIGIAHLTCGLILKESRPEFLRLIDSLPESELEVMQSIWSLAAEGEPCLSAGVIMKKFPALNRLKLTTVLTLITRLQMKGFITSEKQGRSNCYTPLIEENEYKRFAAEDFLEKVFLGDRLGLVRLLTENGSGTAAAEAERAEVK
jgi:predicted transcriptional regulator